MPSEVSTDSHFSLSLIDPAVRGRLRGAVVAAAAGRHGHVVPR